MLGNPLTRDATELLRDAGIGDAQVLRDRYDEQDFGDAEAVFKIGKLLLRFVRDRGQDFVDLTSAMSPDRFYQFDDVEVAMGWSSIEDVVSKSDPEDLAAVLGRVARNRTQLEEAFSGERERFTRAKVETAAEARGKALFPSFRK